MAIKKVSIGEDCTACFMCQDLCPAVFKVENNTSSVLENVNYDEHENYIKDAVKACPVEVIEIEEEQKEPDSNADENSESSSSETEVFDPYS
jgi:ferredoxin